jgi:hypothetical protein
MHGSNSALRSTYNYKHFKCSHWSNLLLQFLTVAPQERKNTFAIATTTAANMIPRDKTLPQHLKPTQMETKKYSISKKVPTQVIVQQLTAHCRDRSRMILVVLNHRSIKHRYSGHVDDSWPLAIADAGFSSPPPGFPMTLPFCWNRVESNLSFNRWFIQNMNTYRLPQ